MSVALASFFVIRYLSAEWSVNTVVLDLSRYCPKFFERKYYGQKFLFGRSVIELCIIQSSTQIIDHVLSIIDVLS